MPPSAWLARGVRVDQWVTCSESLLISLGVLMPGELSQCLSGIALMSLQLVLMDQQVKSLSPESGVPGLCKDVMGLW